MCVDFEYADEFEKQQLDEYKIGRKRAIKVLGLGIAAIPLVALSIVYVPYFAIPTLVILCVVANANAQSWNTNIFNYLVGGDRLYPVLNTGYTIIDKKPKRWMVIFLLVIVAATFTYIFYKTHLHH